MWNCVSGFLSSVYIIKEEMMGNNLSLSFRVHEKEVREDKIDTTGMWEGGNFICCQVSGW